MVTYSLMKKICKFKVINKDLNFPALFSIGRVSEEFDRNESLEELFKGRMYNFSGKHSVVDKPDILNNYKYLIVKNNIK